MEVTSFWPLFFFAAGVQGAFLSVVLFLQREANRSNLFLAILITLFSVSIIDTIVFWTSCSCDNPFWLGPSMVFIFLFGPLFYFFLRGSGGERIQDKWKHFVVGLIVITWHVYFLLGSRLQWTGSLSDVRFINTHLLPVLGWISLFVYAFLSYRFILRLEKKHEISIIRTWHWLGLAFKAYSLFVLLHLALLVSIFLGNSAKTSDILIVLGYSIVIYAIGYLALKTSKFLNGIKVDTTKYKSALLPQKFSESMYEKLMEHMAQHKSFKKNEIRLAELAAELSLSPNQLSQVINQQANQNFAEFINAFRIQEALRLIAEVDRVNQLAYEVGFNNRTTFNRAFKSATGHTPTEYRKKVIDDKVD